MLLSTPYLLREIAHNLFHIDADNAFYPRIKCSEVGTGDDDIEHVLSESAIFEVVVENRTVTRSADFFQAYAVMMACFYVINLEYNTQTNWSEL